MTVALLYRDELKEYDFGPGHPFRGDRFTAFPAFLAKYIKPDDTYRFLKAEPATETDLALICLPDYVKSTTEYFRAAHLGQLLDEGNFFNYHSMDNHPNGRPGDLEMAARIVIGQAKLAADLVMSGKYQKVASIGGGLHHAKQDFGEGFCLYNDVAFAGKYLIEHHHLERILILDTDAHNGNGTSEYFYADPRVLFIDVHQDPRTIYPGTGFADEIGTGAGIGRTVNIPLPPGAGNDSYKAVFEELIEPIVKEYQPQIIVRNGGSDPHFMDQLTHLRLTLEGFRMVGEKVRELTNLCGGKEIDLIASGYNREILPYAWLAHFSGLFDWDIPLQEPVKEPESSEGDTRLPLTRQVIAEVRKNLKPVWRCL
jgi:acetoin utilization protein AcuC